MDRFQNHSGKFSAAITVILVIVAALASGVGTYLATSSGGAVGNVSSGDNRAVSTYKPPTEKTIKLCKRAWPFWTPYVHILRILLEKMGYRVEMINIGTAMGVVKRRSPEEQRM